MVLQVAEEAVKMNAEELEKILDALNELRNIEGVEKAILATRDGIPIPLVSDKKVNSLAAMSATIMATAETVESILGKGLPEQVTVETKQGKLIIRGVDFKILLAVITKSEINIQLVGIEIARAAEKIKEEYGRKKKGKK